MFIETFIFEIITCIKIFLTAAVAENNGTIYDYGQPLYYQGSRKYTGVVVVLFFLNETMDYCNGFLLSDSKADTGMNYHVLTTASCLNQEDINYILVGINYSLRYNAITIMYLSKIDDSEITNICTLEHFSLG